MFCPYCKKEIEDDSLFCSFCGSKIEQQESKEKQQSTCDACGAALEEGAAFCSACGTNTIGSIAQRLNMKKAAPNFKWIYLAAAALLVVIVLIVVGTSNSKYNHYKEAATLYEADSFSEAAALFASLGDYKNSEEWKQEAQYRAAIAGYEAALQDAEDPSAAQASPPTAPSPSDTISQPASPTGDSVDYNSLVRNPEKHAGKTVEFSGEVHIVFSNDSFIINVDDDINKQLSIVTDRCDLPQRVLRGDNIKVTGIVQEELNWQNLVVIQATNVEWY